MCYRSTMLVISILSACIIAVTPCKQYNNHQPTHRRFILSKLAFIKHKHQNNNISFTTSTHQESYSGKKSSLICKDVLFGLRCGASTSEDGLDQEEEIPIDNDDEKSEQIAVDISVETSTTDELDNEIESLLADESVNEEEDCSNSEVIGVEETVVELLEDDNESSSPDETDNSEAAPTPKEEEDDGEDLIAMASNKRQRAKLLHDTGSLHDAAIEFHNAASLLDDALSSSNTENDNIDIDSIVVERATCKLHEALCLFKDGRPGECIDACTDVLGDGVTVVQEENVEEGEAEEDGEEGEDNKDSQPTKTSVVVKVIPVDSSVTSTTTTNIIPSLIRARAHHRRAKARLALNDLDGALDDARSAAFMGDRNAVQFYGRLMREGSGAVDGSTAGGMGMSSPFGSGDGSGGDSSNPFLEGMFQSMGGTNNNQHPLMPSGAGSSDFQSSLLSSLLTNNNSPGSGSGGGDPFGLMSSLLGSPSSSDSNNTGKRGRRGKSRKGKSNNKGGGMDNLAKSVMSNLLKRVEDENTQETICTYLQSTNTQQIMTFASMAGVQMKEDNARRLASLANGVTVKGIRKSITNIKRFISITKTCRKILKVIDKYKAMIVLGMLFYWARSAVNRPIAITSKKAKKELQQAAAFLIAPSLGSRRQLSLGSSLCNGAKALSRLCMSDACEDDMSHGIEEELERLQNQLSLIEAIEERNRAQLESFVDETDQWESLEEDERVLLSSKDEILKKMEVLSEEIVMLFMGQKVKNG